MSDTLKKLITVEKQAAALVAEAEIDARGRTARARAEVQKKREDLVKSKAAELEAAVETERRALAGERETRTKACRAELAARHSDPAALARRLAELVESGSA
jgi:hypothetical protein